MAGCPRCWTASPILKLSRTHFVENDRLSIFRRWTCNATARIFAANLQSSHPNFLKVKRDQVISACKQLLDELPVNDIDIQEVPIEDVIRQIFAR